MFDKIPEAGLRDRFLTLRAMPFATYLDDDALIRISEHARNRRFRRGEYLATSGKPVESMFVVLNGRVTATAHGRHLVTAEKNNAVGVTALFTRDPDGITAIADEDTDVLELPSEALLAAYREDFSLVRNALRFQCRAILERRNRLPQLSGGEAPGVGTWRDRELTVVERVFRIRESIVFGDANLDAVFALARRSEEVRIPAGEMLWNLGDPATFWYQIEYGLVRCENAEGEATVVGSDFVVGPMDCWAELGRSFSAQAQTDVIAYRVGLESILDVMETYHDLAMAIVAIIAATNLNSLIEP
ncbi:MAG: cyclic nucleotide-binding domain-containing protein [Myxococcota bacterium]